MQKHHADTTEYIPQSEDTTYQTGSSRPHAEHRGLIAVLMILVIFLGGIASILGLMNLHLLQAMRQQKAAADHVSIVQDPSVSTVDTDTVPTPPPGKELELKVEEQDLPAQQISPQEIFAKNEDSVVTVQCQDGTALGVVVDAAGFILTNASPVCQRGPIYVTLANGQRYRAALVGTDYFTDLAVLYIQADALTAAQFASGIRLAAGDFVAGLTLNMQLHAGQLSRRAEYAVGQDNYLLLQSNLPVPSGPVYNSHGRIIGFASDYLSGDEQVVAISSCTLKEVVEQIVANGTVPGRPCLGVELEEVQPLHQHYFQLPQGLRVTRNMGEGENALLQGDIIISLNDQPITDRLSLCAALRTLQEGDLVTAVVLRDQEQTTLELTIQLSGQ